MLKDKNLVSVIVPCYNSEKYIFRLFDSIINQTYPYIEVVVVDDGSTDDIDKLINKYYSIFEKHKISFKYIKKSNKGPASAINEGLKHISGDFLIWPDSDDWLVPTSIEKRVNFMKSNPCYGMVIGQVIEVDETNVDLCVRTLEIEDTSNHSMFQRLLWGNGVFFAPVGYMVTMEALKKSIPNLSIFEGNRAGQNWQIMLPISYNYECGFLNEPVGYYLRRSNSLSHDIDTFGKLYKRFNELEEILINVIASINMDCEDKNKILNQIKVEYARKRFELSAYHNNKEKMLLEYKSLKQCKANSIHDIFTLLRGRITILNKLYKIAKGNII